ncbi:cytochrome P450 [Mycena olivaceomarginata]|nr:cytochrome P450 [Mycena olivaceomarginata]
MSSENMITAWCLLCLVFVPILYLRRRRSLPFPPGPRKLPLIGDLLVMPSYCQWEVYAQWSKELDSDIIHLAVPGASIIILSSVEAAKDLLDKRSAIYSDSPFQATSGKSNIFPPVSHNGFDVVDRRTHRRLSHRALDGAAANRFRPQTLKAAHDLLRRLLEEPEAFAEHFDHVIGANMISVAYGLDVAPSGDPFLAAGDAVLDILQETLIPGRFLVNTIPILRYVPSWVPGAGFKRQAAQWKKEMEEHVDQPFQAAKRNMNDGLIRPSFTMDNLRSLDGSADDDAREEDIKNVAGSIYTAGKDTTRFALRVFVRGILENPEAQKKAQEEIDAVMRPGHLPNFADEADLPWVTACVKETLRWWPILPLGLTRFIGVEDVYHGYRIPAGSYVMPNAWSLQTVYPDPEAFKPERFLLDGKVNPAVRDPDATFRFRRIPRVCAGKDMAWNTLWIMVASMLATFRVFQSHDRKWRGN